MHACQNWTLDLAACMRGPAGDRRPAGHLSGKEILGDPAVTWACTRGDRIGQAGARRRTCMATQATAAA